MRQPVTAPRKTGRHVGPVRLARSCRTIRPSRQPGSTLATRALDDGTPDKAFKPVEGDDARFAAMLEKLNNAEHVGQGDLFELFTETKVTNAAFATELRRIIDAPSATLRDVRRQAAAYDDWKHSTGYVREQHIADAWCAAFMWHKTKDAPTPVTQKVFARSTIRRVRLPPRRHTRRSSGCGRSSASSTGTWRSPMSSRCRRTPPSKGWTRPRGGPAASPAFSATRRGTRSTSRTRSTSAWSTRRSPPSRAWRDAPASPGGSRRTRSLATATESRGAR
jgi:hypothetical protein